MHRTSIVPSRSLGFPASTVAALCLLSCGVLALCGVGASPAGAHEPVVLPTKIGETTRILNLISRQGHLNFSGAPIDLGDVLMGSSASASFSVANSTARDLTLALSAPPDLTVAPSTLTLAAGATSTPLSIAWIPTQSGAFAGELTFTVSHAGVGKATEESLSVVGNAGSPASLRFDVPTFAELDVDRTDFGMASPEHGNLNPPTFEMTITNVGGLPARDLRAAITGPGGTFAGLGVCQGIREATICINKKIGTDGNGQPIVLEQADFGDLAPGASVTALWRIVPSQAGLIDRPYDFRFETGGESTERIHTFGIAGEVIAYAIPGTGFLKAGAGNGGGPGFGGTVDPLGDDDLGALRPTGFDARTVFSAGEVDTVDLRTGSLTLAVPIGGPQAIRGPLSYELKAVFNSHIWHRRTLSEVSFPTPQGTPRTRPISGEYPNPIFNLGTGWSFHLGRLLPPYRLTSISTEPPCQPNPLEFQKSVDTGDRFVYVDSNGTQHEFWTKLHGNEIQTNNPADVEPYDQEPFLYARDGSYLRLALDPNNPNRRWIEEPSGIKRLFVNLGDAREPTLPDQWLLKSIEDPYGNTIVIDYGSNTWTIRDQAGPNNAAWRTTTVHFDTWTGSTALDPMVVTGVDLPGFNGAATPRSYHFTYRSQPESLTYPTRSAFHTVFHNVCPSTTDLTFRMPRLDKITMPDGSSYDFAYEHPADDRIRLQSAQLPTGATIGYQYATVWDSPPSCSNPTAGASVNGVVRRTVTQTGGGVLADRRFLRETRRTDDVPNTICQAFSVNDTTSQRAPFSEQTVAVWNALETGKSTASIHYFNIYPYDDRCNRPGQPTESTELCHPLDADGINWRLDSKRSHIERNLKISHQTKDPLDDALHLSEQLYDCELGLNAVAVPRNIDITQDHVGDDISALTSNMNCTKRQTTYAQYEVARAGHGCHRAGAHCLRDSRLKASRNVFHDDADRWLKTAHSNFDGLGNYRKTTTRSTFEAVSQHGSLEQERFRNWSPGVGTLTLNDDHTVNNGITLPNRWLLRTWNYHWTTEGGEGRGGEACFDPNLGHITHQRTWNATSVHPSTIANGTNILANRTSQDLVTSNEVNTATGELDHQRFFGADTYAVPTENNWCSTNVWTESNQDYAVEHIYEHGILAQKWVSDDSIFDVRRAIDQNTGWPRTETTNSGEVFTFDYDPMGRVTWATSQLTASQKVHYQQQVNGRWQLTATTYPKDTVPNTSAPTPIRIYEATYDGLGRLSSETLPLFNDNPNNSSNRNTVTRTVRYHPSGSVHSVSPLDAPSGPPTTIHYDYRARPLTVTNPDGSKVASQYSGIRKTVLVNCVNTGANSSNGICKNTGLETADTVLKRDWKGRTIAVTAPVDGDPGIGAFETTFEYDPLDKRTRARRTHTEAGAPIPQVRSWTYNGLGFLTRENIPERTAIDFRDFTTRGAARIVEERGRTKNLTFDRVGRLRRIAVGSRALKRFVYCDPEAVPTHPTLCSTTGPSNGQLIAATRNNYRLPADSGVGVLATWLIESTFGFDAAGRQSDRKTAVSWGSGWSSNPHVTPSVVTTFGQTWAYDDLGNITALGYPTCDTQSPDCTGTGKNRTVDFTHRQGFFLTKVTEGTLGASLKYHGSGLISQVQHLGGGGNDNYGIAGGMPRIASIDLGVGTAQRFNLGSITYDWAGNITASGGDAFTYDKNRRLVAATVQGTTRAYQYDNFDNLRNENLGPPFDTGLVDLSTNQLRGNATAYDAFGNLTHANGGFQLVYDELDKLAGIHDGAGGFKGSLYDHNDLRVLHWLQPEPTIVNETWTLRDGLTVIREFIGRGPAMLVSRDYIHAGSRRIASKDHLTGEERHYHQDQVGNARLITGAGAKRVHYEPFGEAIGGTSGEPSVGFQGHENDGLTTHAWANLSAFRPSVPASRSSARCLQLESVCVRRKQSHRNHRPNRE